MTSRFAAIRPDSVEVLVERLPYGLMTLAWPQHFHIVKKPKKAAPLDEWLRSMHVGVSLFPGLTAYYLMPDQMPALEARVIEALAP